MKEPLEDQDNQGVLNYINNLFTYVSDLADTFLGVSCDAEDPDLVLGEDVGRLCTQTEVDHGRMGQDEDMDR